MHRETVFKKADDIITRKLLDETILVPIKGNLADMRRIFSISPVARFIWERIDGQTPIGSICDAVVSEFDVDIQQAEADLIDFVGQLEDTGLILENPDDGLPSANTG